MVAGEGIGRKFGKVMYTLLYLKWITNKDLLNSRWNSAQCYEAAWMGGGVWGEWIQVYAWLSTLAVHLEPPHLVNQLYLNTEQSSKFKKYIYIYIKKRRKRQLLLAL